MRRARFVLAALLFGTGACSSRTAATSSPCPAALAAHPTGPAWQPPADPSSPVAASFTLSADPTSPALAGSWRQPLAAPLTIGGATGGDGSGLGLALHGGVKRFAKHPERLFFELTLVSTRSDGLADVMLTVDGVTHAAAVYDLSRDPLAAATTTPLALAIGGVGPEGASARIHFGVDTDGSGQPITMTVALSARTTARTATTSAPLALTADGRELWTTFADGDRVGVVDTAADAEVASLPVAGRPSSVALTPDGALALVACATCNQLVVLDRARRAVVQVLGEAEGIGREPRHVVLSPDGARAWVSAYVGDRVTALERVGDAFRVVGSVDVGRRPVGMSLTPDGKTLYVAHFLPHGPIVDNGGWVSVVDTDALAEVATAELRDDGNEREAACLGMVGAFSGVEPTRLSFEATPTQLAGVFLAPGGGEAWVPALRVAGFPILEGDVSQLGFMFATLGANSPLMLFPLDTRTPRDAGFRRAGSVIDFTDRDEAFLRCYPGTDDAEAVRASPGTAAGELQFPGVTIPSQATLLADSGVARFVGWSRGGRRALVLSYVADELLVLDAATHSPTSQKHLMLSGSNPIGLAVTPSGDKAYVAYENSPFVSTLDLSQLGLAAPTLVPYRFDPGAAAGQGASIITFLMLVRDVSAVPELPPVREVGQIAIADDPMDPALRRGKILFTSSNPEKYPTLTGSREAACAACHPDGGNDGSVWSTMEGERRTIGLWGGTASRGWLHASATHHSADDFATTIVHDRLGGSGLDAGDEAALAGFIARGVRVVQPPAVDAALAARGQALFDRHCRGCHAAADGGDAAGDTPTLHDVGTATDWAHVTLSEAFTRLFPPVARRVLDELRGDRALGGDDDVQATLKFTPRPDRPRGQFKSASLVDCWQNNVFFHDGRFDSLADAVAYFDTLLGLGLSADDRAAIVEYLKTR